MPKLTSANSAFPTKTQKIDKQVTFSSLGIPADVLGFHPTLVLVPTLICIVHSIQRTQSFFVPVAEHDRENKVHRALGARCRMKFDPTKLKSMLCKRDWLMQYNNVVNVIGYCKTIIAFDL